MAQKDVMDIAKAVVNEWKRVGRALGMEDATLDTIEQDNKRNTAEQSYQMLRQWKQQNPSNVTYGALAEALLHRTVDMCSVVQDYCSQK